MPNLKSCLLISLPAGSLRDRSVCCSGSSSEIRMCPNMLLLTFRECHCCLFCPLVSQWGKLRSGGLSDLPRARDNGHKQSQNSLGTSTLPRGTGSQDSVLDKKPSYPFPQPLLHLKYTLSTTCLAFSNLEILLKDYP